MPLIPKRSESLGINTVCYFTKFAIPPLSSLPRGRESNPSPCFPRHISPGWPGGLLLGQADDMCQRNLPNNQGREKSKCDKFFHYKTTSWSSSVSEFNGIASWDLAWFLEKKYRYNWSKCRRASKMRSCEDFSGLRPKKNSREDYTKSALFGFRHAIKRFLNAHNKGLKLCSTDPRFKRSYDLCLLPKL